MAFIKFMYKETLRLLSQCPQELIRSMANQPNLIK